MRAATRLAKWLLTSEAFHETRSAQSIMSQVRLRSALRIVLVFLAAVAALPLASTIVLGIIVTPVLLVGDYLPRALLERPAHRDWQIIDGLGAQVWETPMPALFSRVNGGDWTFLCVAGGYTEPLRVLQQRSPRRLLGWMSTRAFLTGWLLNVQEYDFAVIYVRADGQGDLFYFQTGTPDTQHFAWCTASI